MQNVELSIINVVESESVACIKDRQKRTHKTWEEWRHIGQRIRQQNGCQERNKILKNKECKMMIKTGIGITLHIFVWVACQGLNQYILINYKHLSVNFLWVLFSALGII